MNNKEKLLENKILTPALWQHRIKVYEALQEKEATRIVIKYPESDVRFIEAEKENIENQQARKWQDMLKNMELDINGIKLSFNK